MMRLRSRTALVCVKIFQLGEGVGGSGNNGEMGNRENCLDMAVAERSRAYIKIARSGVDSGETSSLSSRIGSQMDTMLSI